MLVVIAGLDPAIHSVARAGVGTATERMPWSNGMTAISRPAPRGER
jgi:hypothetical protein